MPSTVFWLIALGPLGLIALGLLPYSVAHRRIGLVHLLARSLSTISILSSLSVLAWVSLEAPIQAPLLGIKGLGFSLYLDLISATMFALVSFIGLIVIVYSRNYLAGDPGQGRFMKWISLTLGSVLLLMISGNLLQFFVAWVSTSLCLHRLLTFYSERPAAILAARKKWVVSRLGDLCLLGAIILLYRLIGSLEYTSILQAVREAQATGVGATTLLSVAPLFALAALLKSAQFPVHGWLLEVMETPTPVSALLHAGIINAGGFLLIRFSHLLILSPAAMNTLLVVGAITAVFGSLVMLTQVSVKVSLAYSTIAQMGFMMLECGLGVFSAALLHIIAHSLYKAHAFLSSGEAVKLGVAQPDHFESKRYGSALAPVLATLVAILTVSGVGAALGSTLLTRPGSSTLSYIFAIGVAILLSKGFEGGRLSATFVGRIFAGVFGVTILFYATQYGAEAAFAGSIPTALHDPSSLDLILRGSLILLFSSVLILQSVLPDQRESALWCAFYTHLSNGFYINTIANRLAIRFWPAPAPRSAVPSYIPTHQSRGDS